MGVEGQREEGDAVAVVCTAEYHDRQVEDILSEREREREKERREIRREKRDKEREER